MTEIKIRTATSDDLAVMALLWSEKITLVQQSDSYFNVLPDAVLRWQDRVLLWLSDPEYVVFVGEQQGAVIGFIIGKLQESPPGLSPQQYGSVLDIVIDMHTYHGGLASGLANALWTWFGTHNIDRVSITAPRYFAVEQAFWRSMGTIQRRDEMWITL